MLIPEIKKFVERWHQVTADYTISQQTRLTRRREGVSGIGRSADFHYRLERMLMLAMETARDDDRNNQVVGQGISRLVHNVMQDGFKLDAKTGASKEFDNELEARWEEEAADESFSSTGEHTFHQQAEFALRATVVDGDIVALPRDDFTLQLSEAHRLRTPYNATRGKNPRNIVHGIVFDNDARPQEYWLTREDINPLSVVTQLKDVEQIPARDSEGNKQVLHILNPKRVTQHRGFTALAPVAFPTGMLDDVMLAKLVQQQAASSITILTEVDKSLQGKYTSKRGKKGETYEETLSDGTTRQIEGLACGVQLGGVPGVKYTGFSPNIPNPEFFAHARLVLQIIALNLHMPLIVFLMDATETNFSGWRGAMDQGKIGWRWLQRFVAAKLHRPVYKWRVRSWLARDSAFRGRVAAAAKDAGEKFNLFRHGWNCPTWPYVQPVEDATASILKRHGLLTSPRRQSAEDGLDWREQIVDETVEDVAYAMETALTAVRKFNSKLTQEEKDAWGLAHWKDALSIPLPDKINENVSIQRSMQPKPEPSPAAPAKANGKPKAEVVDEILL